MEKVIEIVRFHLDKDASVEEFMASDPDMNQFLSNQEGMIHRSLCQQEDGSFIDIVHWNNLASAQKAQQAFYETQLCKTIGLSIDVDSIHMEYIPLLTSTACDHTQAIQ